MSQKAKIATASPGGGYNYEKPQGKTASERQIPRICGACITEIRRAARFDVSTGFEPLADRTRYAVVTSKPLFPLRGSNRSSVSLPLLRK